MENFRETLSIFLSESFILNNIVIGYLFLIFIAISLSEFFFQKTDYPLYEFIITNMIWVVLTTFILVISEYIFSWRSQWFGGEALSAVILFLLSMLLLLIIKKMIYWYFGFNFNSANTMLCLPVLATHLPVLLCLGYIFALGGADWSK